MPEIRRSALVPYTPAQMFDVVNDVAQYPVFLPWCAASEVISESESEMVARLEIARGGMGQAFTTRNSLNRPDSIAMQLVQGPFARLDGLWRFDAVGHAGCRVSLDLNFKVDGSAMRFALGTVFGIAADHMVDAFCERAEQLYG